MNTTNIELISYFAFQYALSQPGYVAKAASEWLIIKKDFFTLFFKQKIIISIDWWLQNSRFAEDQQHKRIWEKVRDTFQNEG